MGFAIFSDATHQTRAAGRTSECGVAVRFSPASCLLPPDFSSAVLATAEEYNPPAPMPGFPTYLFDLDGTLIDSIELILASFRHTMRTHLGTVPPDAEWRAGFGRPLRPQLARYARDRDQG